MSAAISTVPRPNSTWCWARSRITIGCITISAPFTPNSDENDKASDEFKEIPEDDEHYVEARLQLAYLYDKESDYDKAITNLKQALAKKPNDPEIMGYLVGVYQEKKDYPNAIDLAKQMVALEPRNDKYLLHAGRALRRGQAEGTKRRRDAARRSRSILSNAPALNYLGYTHMRNRGRIWTKPRN